MHVKILENASLEQLRDYLTKELYKVKEKDYEMYEELELDLYKEVYGCHFNDWLLERALSGLINEDGSKGAHWTVEQTEDVARSNAVSFKTFNKYDWCYVMNMLYSDYYGSVPNDTVTYMKMANKFLNDKDAKEGKALHYWLAMK